MLQIFDVQCVAQSPRLVADDGGALFMLGDVVVSPKAACALAGAGLVAAGLLGRHIAGDWGDVYFDDWRMNNAALLRDDAIFSQYWLGAVTLWVYTYGDRSKTLVICSDEWAGW